MKTRVTLDLLEGVELQIGKTPLLQVECSFSWHLGGHQSELIHKVISCRVQAPDDTK